MAMDQETRSTMAALRALQKTQHLSILTLTESIGPVPSANPNASIDTVRTSDVSTDTPTQTVTPAMLEADLAHYMELFSKLRFSYLEQVTKEKFLRAILGDPPLLVEAQDNIELEAQLVEAKAQLKEQKIESARLVSQIETRARELTLRHEIILEQTNQLSTLPAATSALHASIADLRLQIDPDTTSAATGGGGGPEDNLPLPATLSLLSAEEARLAHLDHQISTLQTTLLPRKTRELERLETELRPLEAKRQASCAAAREAQRRKDAAAGGVADELEERGRWWRGVEAGVRGMLGVKS
ncbi:MAG: hypothetical protein M1825_003725 [Sarcosagium campestre]|nr:MAG: hypothetical protein M1825_003725 [Sarcosagium campestre]